MFGVALEGGGAKGAFHMGAIKALVEHGYKIEGAVGTSIGAFNAALVSQGDFEAGYEFWINVQPSTLFDIDDEHMRKLLYNEYDMAMLRYFKETTKKILGNKGIGTDRLRSTVERLVSEEKLRESKLDYGLVTVSISELKPVELYKEQIPSGKVTDYIMASANLPVFRSEGIDDKSYFDGGIYNNCPVNMLIDKGYDEVFAIRTAVRDKMRNVSNTEAKIVNVTPSEDLGSVLVFDQDLIRKNITMGYYDTLRHIKGLKGRKYYVSVEQEYDFVQLFHSLSEEQIMEAGKKIKCPEMDVHRMLFEKILPTTATLLKLPSSASYQDIFIGMLEVLATKYEINRFEVYTLQDLFDKVKTALKETMVEETKRKDQGRKSLRRIASEIVGTNQLEELSYQLVNNLALKS